MPRSNTSDRHRAQRGAITWVTVLLLLTLASGAYLATVYVPVYALHLQLKRVVREYGNLAIRNPYDAELVQAMVEKIRSLEQVSVELPDGRTESHPAVELRAENVTWERRSDPAMLRVAFAYEREVQFPFLHRSAVHTMSVDMDMDIARVKWGTAP